jgi:hypothetical protein
LLLVGCSIAGFLFFFKFRNFEFNLPKILYIDSQNFFPNKMSPEEYFKEATRIKTTKLIRQIDSEEKDDQNNNPRTLIQVEHEHTTNENILQLADNKINNNEGNDIKNNNFINQPSSVDITPKQTVGFETAPSDAIYSILDYSNLKPKDSLKYDNRNIVTFIKDKLIADHTIINLIFNCSLREPKFIRIINLIFTLSMQLAINAMLYTDSYIEDLINNTNQVK